MTTGQAVPFVKGHGTENDFVLLPDVDARLEVTPARVAALCDRRAGLGADGVIRVVPTADSPEVAHLAAEARWFMDYRNADGSAAEMCGNGARVFARHLLDEGLEAGERFAIATRGGVREVAVEPGGWLAVDLGVPDPVRQRVTPHVEVGDHAWPAVGLFLPNPHVVVFVDDLDQAGPLTHPPGVTPPLLFPDGVNVEFVVAHRPGSVGMRVFERGVGETRSCGSGACAAVWAARRRAGADAPETYDVAVPGGLLRVTERADGHLVLAGPAVLVASGTIDGEWWEAHG